MGAGTKDEVRPLWIFLTVGAVVGLVVGIVVSSTTEVAFAPEIGLALGLVAGWGVCRSWP